MIALAQHALRRQPPEVEHQRVQPSELATSITAGEFPVPEGGEQAIDRLDEQRALLAFVWRRAVLRAPLRVIVGGSSLSGDVVTELKKVSPQTTDWDSVVVIQDGALPGSGRRLGALVASVLCLLGGGALGWSALRSRRED